MKARINKLQRTAQILRIIARYGFKDLVLRLSGSKDTTYDDTGDAAASQEALYVRIRKAIEELGPVFIKFAQALTTREGLLPEELVAELRVLEDNVQEFELDIIPFLEEHLMVNCKETFAYIAEKPFASASISQVYKARLLNGDDVILKIRRPGIEKSFAIDLALLKDMAQLLSNYNEPVRNINLPLAVEAFSRSLLEELSLEIERQNLERFCKNFAGNTDIYLPEIYDAYSSNLILCMEWIAGTKVTDTVALETQGFAPKEIARRGLHLYLEQVLVHGFFHGDPHPGNLIVCADGRIAFIDFGNMGKLYTKDRQLLEEFVQAALDSDALQLANVIEDVALTMEVKDKAQFIRSLEELLQMVENAPIAQLQLEVLINKLWSIVGQNSIHFPEYIYQLIRGVSLLEGIGRKLDPQMNIIAEMKPFINKVIIQRLSPQNLFKANYKKLFVLLSLFNKMPENMQLLMRKLKQGDALVQFPTRELQEQTQAIKEGNRNISLAIVLLAFCLLSFALTGQATRAPWANAAFIISLISSALLGLYLLYLLLRKK